MVKKRAVTNSYQHLLPLFVEPEARDYWLQPGQTFELQAQVKTNDEDFEIDESDQGITVWPSNSMGFISVSEGGKDLTCGHQRPSNWP